MRQMISTTYNVFLICTGNERKTMRKERAYKRSLYGRAFMVGVKKNVFYRARIVHRSDRAVNPWHSSPVWTHEWNPWWDTAVLHTVVVTLHSCFIIWQPVKSNPTFSSNCNAETLRKCFQPFDQDFLRISQSDA